MTPKEVDRELLLAYLEGTRSPEQLRLIREYLQDEAYRDSLHRFMEEEWVSTGRSELPPLPGMEERYARFRAVHQAPVSRIPLIRMTRWAAAAAAVLVFCLVGYSLLRNLFKRQDEGAGPQWLSWHNGHNVDLHARGMVVTGIVCIEPSVVTFLIHAVGDEAIAFYMTISVVYAVLIGLIVLERRQKRGRWVFPLILCLYLLAHSVIVFHLHFPPWLEFCKWFLSTQLT